MIKGVLHPDDARAAVRAGADAVIVSNHGGRQLDTVPGACSALPGVVAAIQGEAGDEKTVLACAEEGLRQGGLGGVVAEVARLPMAASRRLQLAAETSGTIGIAVRRWRRAAEAANFGQPTAAVTCWRVTALPSTPLPVPGIGRALVRRADPQPCRRMCRF